jgi:arsenate reductase
VQPQRRTLADGAAFFDELAPEDFQAESAGTEPAREIWPEAVEVMHEAGIDISGRQPKKLTREMQLPADCDAIADR